MHLNIDTLIRWHKKVKTRQFTEKSVKEFQCLLKKESWQEVFKMSEVSATLHVCTDSFVTILLYHSPVNTSIWVSRKWNIPGTKVSSKKMRFFENSKRKKYSFKGSTDYIKRYQLAYKKRNRGSQ